MNLKRLSKVGYKSFTAVIAVWMSGLVLLLACSGQMPNQADGYCPLVKLGARCDKTDQNKDSFSVTNQTDEQGIDCCSFIPAFFDKTRTFDKYQSAVVTPTSVVVETPRYFVPVRNVESVLNYRSTILLKNKTFLKNRTFRI